jgi:rod shape-determining protein MreB
METRRYKFEPAGHMICEIGDRTTEISIITPEGIMATSSVRMGSTGFNEDIIHHIRNVHNLIICTKVAEWLKIESGNAVPDKTITKIEIEGINAITGLPQRLEIESVEVRDALKESITMIIDEIKNILCQASPDLVLDIEERGIVMTRSDSRLTWLPKLVSKGTGIPVLILPEHSQEGV